MTEYVIAKYLRLSLDDAKTDSMSIENQSILIDKHIANLDFADAKVIEFVDNGFSGTHFERPAVQELLELVREGKINCIAVKDFSRFGRNAIETGYFIERVFPLFRVRFISVSDYFDSNDYDGDTGGMEVAFKFLMHEYYSRDLSKKIKSAKHEKMRRGEFVTKNCLFGYVLNEARQMVIDEPAAETIRLVFSLALEGNSLAQIAKQLYDTKRLTPSAHKGSARNSGYNWNLSCIHSMLREEQYTGTYIVGRTKIVDVGSGVAVKVPESEWYKLPDHHPVIIDRTLFDAVQAVVLSPKERPKRKRELGTWQRYGIIDDPIKGKVVCGCCGHAMVLSSTANARFRCRFTHSAVDAECHGLSVSAKELSGMIFDIITKQAQVILNIDSLNQISELDSKLAQQTEVENQIAALDDEKRRLYESLILGKINSVDYKAAKAEVEVEMTRLNRVNSAHIYENERLIAANATNERLQTLAESASNENSLTRPLVDMLISKVSIFPGDKVEIEWKVSAFGDVK